MHEKLQISSGRLGKALLLANTVIALIYFSWWFFPGHIGNPVLFGLLLFGECYHVFMALTFWYTLWPTMRREKLTVSLQPPPHPGVAIFITVAGEPKEVIYRTALAATTLSYDTFHVFILNDGYVAGKPNWHEAEEVATELGIRCITRTTPGGAKAGNINHALSLTDEEIIVLFDADMAPHSDFLEKVIPYFADPRTGFVQAPQFYTNAQRNDVSGAAWEQQELFFGPIMEGKDRVNSAFICGTNVAIRREALNSVGGLYEKSIAEDFLTSLLIHKKGWQSYYLPVVLAEGLAPEDLLSYYKQQLRWARGSLEVLFGSNPLFTMKLTLAQKIHYLSSGLYWANGLIVIIDAIMPLIFLFTGIQPVAATTTSFAIFFVPFMFVALYTLYRATDGAMTFRSISFSQSSATLQLRALFLVLLRRKTAFSVTAKQGLSGNFISLAYPHMLYIVLTAIASGVALLREGINPSVMTNIAWAVFNVILFLPFIRAAVQWQEREVEPVAMRNLFEDVGVVKT